MHSLLRRAVTALGLAALAVSAACSDSTTSSTSLKPGSPSYGYALPAGCTDTTTCTGLPGDGAPHTEKMQVCKYYPAGEANPPSVQVLVEAHVGNPLNYTDSPRSLTYTIAPNTCVYVWRNGEDDQLPDTVTVTELVPAGWVGTSQLSTIIRVGPRQGSLNVFDTVVYPESSSPSATALIAGPQVPGALVVFRNTRAPGSIGDFVWQDLNGNGVQDFGEPGLAGVTVTLSGAGSATTTTDANGAYVFNNLTPGTYTVSVATPAGYAPSPTGAGTPSTDSNGGSGTTTINGTTDTTIDFGFSPLFSLGDFVWNDLDGDGVQDAGEPGIAGLTVTLSNGATTTTSAGGQYTFGSLPAGTYTVCVSGLPAGYVPTYDLDGIATPSCAMATVGPSATNVDFGYRANACPAQVIGSLLGPTVTNNLFLFTNGSSDANWQGASKGFVGNAVVNGLVAKERTSGSFAYAGTISTNDATLGPWQSIVTNNPGQAFASTGQSALVSQLTADLTNAFANINALPVTAGYASRVSTSLNGLNTQNGVPETIVVNVTSGLQVSSQIVVTGDAGDLFILRWDTDANSANGYQGQVKFQSGGAIVPKGGLTAANFIHVAGDINASGGGSNPPAPYPQGPRYTNGTGALATGASNFNGGGFFTGYWLTTGDPVTHETASLSNAIFVGGWYSTTTKFSMTSGTSGVHVVCQ